MATEKPSARRRFSRDATREEMRGYLQVIVNDLAPDRNRKAAIQFASGLLGLPYGVCKRLLYGEVQRIEAHLADQVRAYVQRAEHLIEERAKLNAQIREFRAEAPAFMARLAPKPLPDVDAKASPVKRGESK